MIDKTSEKELAWILYRLVQQQPEVQYVSWWSGFKHFLSKNDRQQTIVGPISIVNVAAHEFKNL